MNPNPLPTETRETVVKVEHLSKRFGRVQAVNDLSFQVRQGEVVGVLGPNGAGKSTTMRILAGYLPASGGQVQVAGFDVFAQSLEARRRIGYMPEHVPLYPDMRVNEYLRYRARIKGMTAPRRRTRVTEVKDLCGLNEVGRRILGHLSKGFRQRVGLADALLHEPDILILDEPTIGLDPAQIREIREVIKGLAERHTILLSTHILPEVEITCSRVLIFNRGRIVVSDTPENLHELGGLHGLAVVMEVAGTPTDVATHLAGLDAVAEVEVQPLDGGWVRAVVQPAIREDVRVHLFECCRRQGWPLRELRHDHSSLEDVFLQLVRHDGEGDLS